MPPAGPLRPPGTPTVAPIPPGGQARRAPRIVSSWDTRAAGPAPSHRARARPGARRPAGSRGPSAPPRGRDAAFPGSGREPAAACPAAPPPAHGVSVPDPATLPPRRIGAGASAARQERWPRRRRTYMSSVSLPPGGLYGPSGLLPSAEPETRTRPSSRRPLRCCALPGRDGPEIQAVPGDHGAAHASRRCAPVATEAMAVTAFTAPASPGDRSARPDERVSPQILPAPNGQSCLQSDGLDQRDRIRIFEGHPPRRSRALQGLEEGE